MKTSKFNSLLILFCLAMVLGSPTILLSSNTKSLMDWKQYLGCGEMMMVSRLMWKMLGTLEQNNFYSKEPKIK